MTTRPPPSSKCKPKASSKASLVPLPGGVAIFKRLCGMDSLAVLLASARSYDRCWTPPITLMAMILGHLIGGGTLETVLALARTGLLDSLCSSTKMLSTLLESTDSTSGYSQARARLGITWLRHCLGAQAKELQNLAGGWQWHGMAVRVLDGTMITMRPHGRIPERYPPHSNQHGTCYWCQTRVLACMCLGTGVILNLVTGNAMDSEQAQTVRLLLFGDLGGPSTLPATVLWMGDANFGVWRVVAVTAWSRAESRPAGASPGPADAVIVAGAAVVCERRSRAGSAAARTAAVMVPSSAAPDHRRKTSRPELRRSCARGPLG